MNHLQRCVCILILLNCATLLNCECYSSESYRCDLNGEVFDPQCIHKSRVCDGHEDCDNKSDESRCSNGLSAGATTGLIVGGIFGGVMLIGLVVCLVSTYVPGCPGYEEDRGHGHWVRYGHNRRQWVWDVPYEERPWWGQICRKRPPASNLTSLYSIPQPASPTPPSDMDIHSNPGSGDASAATAYQESQFPVDHHRSHGPSRHVQDPESQIPSEPPPSYDEIQFVSRPKRAVDSVEADINERFV